MRSQREPDPGDVWMNDRSGGWTEECNMRQITCSSYLRWPMCRSQFNLKCVFFYKRIYGNYDYDVRAENKFCTHTKLRSCNADVFHLYHLNLFTEERQIVNLTQNIPFENIHGASNYYNIYHLYYVFYWKTNKLRACITNCHLRRAKWLPEQHIRSQTIAHLSAVAWRALFGHMMDSNARGCC